MNPTGDLATIYNRTTARVELSDGSMLVDEPREGFAVTEYEVALAEAGTVIVEVTGSVPEPEGGDQADGEGPPADDPPKTPRKRRTSTNSGGEGS